MSSRVDAYSHIGPVLMRCIEAMVDAEMTLSRLEADAEATRHLKVEFQGIDLLDQALTAAGFPEDNTAEFEAAGDRDHPDVYCRDWLYVAFLEHVEKRKTAKEYLAEVGRNLPSALRPVQT
jgi:hypothetical protein